MTKNLKKNEIFEICILKENVKQSQFNQEYRTQDTEYRRQDAKQSQFVFHYLREPDASPSAQHDKMRKPIKTRIQDTENRMEKQSQINQEYRTQDTEYRIQNVKQSQFARLRREILRSCMG